MMRLDRGMGVDWASNLVVRNQRQQTHDPLNLSLSLSTQVVRLAAVLLDARPIRRRQSGGRSHSGVWRRRLPPRGGWGRWWWRWWSRVGWRRR